MIEGFKIPQVTFRIRVGDTSDNEVACAIGGKWTSKTTDDFFKNKRVILFSLPGAFTPTCSSQQLPGFENNAYELKKLGIDEIYCCSVNDSYVMNAWAKKMNISNVKVIPDGSGLFTKYMGMLISIEINIPMYFVKSPDPSGITLTLEIFIFFAQAFITYESFTEQQ